MTIFIVKQQTDVFKSTDELVPVGDKLKPGDLFRGALSATDFELVDKLDEPKGVVRLDHVMRGPATLPSITTDVGRTLFCWAATIHARKTKADRNFLVSVAYYLSDKLGKFANDQRIGPFRYNLTEWLAAVEANKESGVQPEGLFDPAWQVTMAAIRTGNAMKKFADDHNKRSPLPVELFFYERLGEEALTLLKLEPAEPCSKAFAVAPPAGSYGAEIKDRKSGDVIKEVTDGLKAGFVASRADIAQLEPNLRFFNDEDFAPWLTVARVMTSDNLAIQATTLAGTFMTFPQALGPADRRSAAFVAFCLVECGVAEAKHSVPENNKAGLPDTWKVWSAAAETPERPGTIVVTKPVDGKASVGILAETPKDTDTDYKVYFCSDEGTVSVDVKPIAKDKIETLRWLDLTGTAAAVDPAALALAPATVQGTMELARKAFTRLRKAGWTKEQACGILANIQAESSFDHNNITGDGGDAHGLCQWHQDRRNDFEAEYKRPFAGSSFDQQIDFITFEMDHKEKKRAGDPLRQAKTPADAARIVCTEYERPNDKPGESAKRVPLAEAYAAVLL
ncbi:phage tail tip lysozyme [Reyranella soli]|nr:phage tail tip lysozyme [Reyranella soli]